MIQICCALCDPCGNSDIESSILSFDLGLTVDSERSKIVLVFISGYVGSAAEAGAVEFWCSVHEKNKFV